MYFYMYIYLYYHFGISQVNCSDKNSDHMSQVARTLFSEFPARPDTNQAAHL